MSLQLVVKIVEKHPCTCVHCHQEFLGRHTKQDTCWECIRKFIKGEPGAPKLKVTRWIPRHDKPIEDTGWFSRECDHCNGRLEWKEILKVIPRQNHYLYRHTRYIERYDCTQCGQRYRIGP